MKLFFTSLIMLFSLSACMTAPTRGDREIPQQPVVINATQPIAVKPVEVTGGLYSENLDMRLWEDRTAHRVGDILTVQLTEQTSAQQAQNTSVSKANDVSIGTPQFLGQPVTLGGMPLLDASFSPSQSFDGAGSADQSNNLSGSISVTVVSVQQNGNLVVQGQKTIELSDGAETIALMGTVRPADIDTDNTVQSTRIADAKISYKGQGVVSDSNRMGWLSKFFLSVIWPF